LRGGAEKGGEIVDLGPGGGGFKNVFSSAFSPDWVFAIDLALIFQGWLKCLAIFFFFFFLGPHRSVGREDRFFFRGLAGVLVCAWAPPGGATAKSSVN